MKRIRRISLTIANTFSTQKEEETATTSESEYHNPVYRYSSNETVIVEDRKLSRRRTISENTLLKRNSTNLRKFQTSVSESDIRSTEVPRELIASRSESVISQPDSPKVIKRVIVLRKRSYSFDSYFDTKERRDPKMAPITQIVTTSRVPIKRSQSGFLPSLNTINKGEMLGSIFGISIQPDEDHNEDSSELMNIPMAPPLPPVDFNDQPRKPQTVEELLEGISTAYDSSSIDINRIHSDRTEEEGLVFIEKNKRKSVVAGTLEKLISHLADGKLQDTEYIRAFLTTHRFFINTGVLLLKLIQRYYIEPPPNCTPEELKKFKVGKSVIQIRTINVIKKWIELQVSDFDEDEGQLLECFLKKLIAAGGTEAIWGGNLSKALKIQQTANLNIVDEAKAPKPVLPKNMMPRMIRFLDLSPLELARQFTLADFKIFKKIQLSEYFHKGWTKRDKAGQVLSANICTLVANFNKMTSWVAGEIVFSRDEKSRLLTIVRFIELLEHLQELRNYHGMMVVFSALSLGCVRTFESTWRDIPDKKHLFLKQVETLLSPIGNYSKYRNLLKEALPPVLPFQGVYLADLTFIDEVPSKLENGDINFSKMNLISSIFQEIQRFQKETYHIIEVPYIVQFFQRAVVRSEKELYDAAKQAKRLLEEANGTVRSPKLTHAFGTIKQAKKKT